MQVGFQVSCFSLRLRGVAQRLRRVLKALPCIAAVTYKSKCDL